MTRKRLALWRFGLCGAFRLRCWQWLRGSAPWTGQAKCGHTLAAVPTHPISWPWSSFCVSFTIFFISRTWAQLRDAAARCAQTVCVARVGARGVPCAAVARAGMLPCAAQTVRRELAALGTYKEPSLRDHGRRRARHCVSAQKKWTLMSLRVQAVRSQRISSSDGRRRSQDAAGCHNPPRRRRGMTGEARSARNPTYVRTCRTECQ